VAELGEHRLGDADLAENLLGVLAEPRRGTPDPDRRRLAARRADLREPARKTQPAAARMASCSDAAISRAVFAGASMRFRSTAA
jgi:hypothetical protein